MNLSAREWWDFFREFDPKWEDERENRTDEGVQVGEEGQAEGD